MAFRLSLTCVIIVGYQLSQMAISLKFRRFCWFWRHGKTGVSLPQIGITSRTRLHLRLVVVYCYAIPSSPWWSSFHWFETHQIPLYSIIWMLYPLNPIQHSKLSLCLWHATTFILRVPEHFRSEQKHQGILPSRCFLQSLFPTSVGRGVRRRRQLIAWIFGVKMNGCSFLKHPLWWLS